MNQLEADILGKFFLDNSLMNNTLLREFHFEDERHQNIFKMFKYLHTKGSDINPLSINANFTLDKIERNIGYDYLSDVATTASTTSDFIHREKDIIEMWKKRKIQSVLKDASFKLSSDNDLSSFPQYIQQLNEIYGEGENKSFNLTESMANALDRYSDKSKVKGFRTGFYELDHILNGIMRKEYIVIGARPGVGKTAFAINLLDSSSKNNQNVWCYMFSLEMSEDEMIDRMFTSHSSLTLKQLTSKKNVSSEEYRHLSDMAGEIGRIFKDRLYIDDNAGTTMQDVWVKVSRYKNEQPKDSHGIVLIDYLQLLHLGGHKNVSRYEEVSEISRLLKRLAKELDVTVIALSQLNRGNEARQIKKPVISDLRESGQVEQDANTIMLLYREDYYEKETDKKDIIECIVAKNRRGPTGTVEFKFVKEHMRFLNLDRRN